MKNVFWACAHTQWLLGNSPPSDGSTQGAGKSGAFYSHQLIEVWLRYPDRRKASGVPEASWREEAMLSNFPNDHITFKKIRHITFLVSTKLIVRWK